MTVKELVHTLGLKILAGGDGLERSVESVFCCDLLSLVMGKAPSGCAWLTVMGNVNAVAVASLADCACTVLCDSVAMPQDGLDKAQENGIILLQSSLTVYETAIAIHKATLL